MVDPEKLEEQLTELIGDGKYSEAERRLLMAYSELKTAKNLRDLDYVIGQLAHFYSSPHAEDFAKAEGYFLERETLSPGRYSTLQTALFYFYIASNFQKAIEKVDEIGAMQGAATSGDYYSALAIKGHALIHLGRVAEAGEVLKYLLTMIQTNSPQFPFGDEMNFLEAAAVQKQLVPTVHEIVNSIIPKIRSQEYVERAKALLNAL